MTSRRPVRNDAAVACNPRPSTPHARTQRSFRALGAAVASLLCGCSADQTPRSGTDAGIIADVRPSEDVRIGAGDLGFQSDALTPDARTTVDDALAPTVDALPSGPDTGAPPVDAAPPEADAGPPSPEAEACAQLEVVDMTPTRDGVFEANLGELTVRHRPLPREVPDALHARGTNAFFRFVPPETGTWFLSLPNPERAVFSASFLAMIHHDCEQAALPPAADPSAERWINVRAPGGGVWLERDRPVIVELQRQLQYSLGLQSLSSEPTRLRIEHIDTEDCTVAGQGVITPVGAVCPDPLAPPVPVEPVRFGDTRFSMPPGSDVGLVEVNALPAQGALRSVSLSPVYAGGLVSSPAPVGVWGEEEGAGRRFLVHREYASTSPLAGVLLRGWDAGGRSTARLIPAEPPREVPEGEACDPLALADRCAGGLVCRLEGDSAAWTCGEAPGRCALERFDGVFELEQSDPSGRISITTTAGGAAFAVNQCAPEFGPALRAIPARIFGFRAAEASRWQVSVDGPGRAYLRNCDASPTDDFSDCGTDGSRVALEAGQVGAVVLVPNFGLPEDTELRVTLEPVRDPLLGDGIAVLTEGGRLQIQATIAQRIEPSVYVELVDTNGQTWPAESVLEDVGSWSVDDGADRHVFVHGWLREPRGEHPWAAVRLTTWGSMRETLQVELDRVEGQPPGAACDFPSNPCAVGSVCEAADRSGERPGICRPIARITAGRVRVTPLWDSALYELVLDEASGWDGDLRIQPLDRDGQPAGPLQRDYVELDGAVCGPGVPVRQFGLPVAQDWSRVAALRMWMEPYGARGFPFDIPVEIVEHGGDGDTCGRWVSPPTLCERGFGCPEAEGRCEAPVLHLGEARFHGLGGNGIEIELSGEWAFEPSLMRFSLEARDGSGEALYPLQGFQPNLAFGADRRTFQASFWDYLATQGGAPPEFTEDDLRALQLQLNVSAPSVPDQTVPITFAEPVPHVPGGSCVVGWRGCPDEYICAAVEGRLGLCEPPEPLRVVDASFVVNEHPVQGRVRFVTAGRLPASVSGCRVWDAAGGFLAAYGCAPEQPTPIGQDTWETRCVFGLAIPDSQLPRAAYATCSVDKIGTSEDVRADLRTPEPLGEREDCDPFGFEQSCGPGLHCVERVEGAGTRWNCEVIAAICGVD